MAPSGKANKAAKLTPAEYIQLMRKYGIVFEGPQPREMWPREYADIFTVIDDISSIRLSDYARTFGDGDMTIAILKSKVIKLVSSTKLALEQRGSETLWRSSVESKVFKPFTKSILCPRCHNHKSKPHFYARPFDPDARESLERRRSKRRLCSCTLVDLGDITVEQKFRSEFSRNEGGVIIHEDVEKLEKAGLRDQRPDMVMGLGRTLSLDHYTSRMRRRHSPFEQDHILYPFMVVEAKAEKATDSFSSIERQTAFALRTCLELQKNLQRETEVRHQCLVWFFAFKGEEWRLYAAIPDNARTRVIDLWHGTLLSQDCALQIILIIDFLRNWAYDVYRLSVLSCLDGGRLNPQRLTPSVSVLSQMTENELDMVYRRYDGGANLRSESVGGHRNELQIPVVAIDQDTVMKENRKDPYNWTRWIKRRQGESTWTSKMTIRHANLVSIAQTILALPEDADSLQTCLTVCFPEMEVEVAAGRLVEMILDDNLAIPTLETVAIKSLPQRNGAAQAVRALIYFRSGFDRTDWQIVRQILWVTCTQRTLVVLLCLSRRQWSTSEFGQKWDARRCESFTQACKWPRRVSGHVSGGLALMRSRLFLKPVHGEGSQKHFEWTQDFPRTEGSLSLESFCDVVLDTARAKQIFKPYTFNDRKQYITGSGGKTSAGAPTIIGMPAGMDKNGILIKKPQSWPAATQDFCFLVMQEGVDFQDTSNLGRLIHDARLSEDSMFGGQEGHGRCTLTDEETIDRWVEILTGNLDDEV